MALTTTRRILLAMSAASLASPAFAAGVSSADQQFAKQAASGGMAEIQAAQLAQQRSASPQVRQFASRMISDHTDANNELQQIAQQESIDLPSAPDSRDAGAVKRLSGMNGSEFDQSYAQEELRDHQQVVALFRKEATSGSDQALKEFAQKTLPTLQQHLQLAQGLNANR
jgi:putative membrane protein